MKPRAIELHRGDCRPGLASLPDESIDLIITDPPYGKRYHDGIGKGIANRLFDRPGRFSGFTIAGDDRPRTSILPELARVLKPGSALYLFTQWMVEAEWKAAIEAAGLKVRNRLIWVKPHHGMGDTATTYGPRHESVLFATKGRHVLAGPRHGDVWIEPGGCFGGRVGKSHPHQKPTDFLGRMIAASSAPGARVLDPFAGSGSTGVASIRAGRRFVGWEIDPATHATAAARLADATSEARAA